MADLTITTTATGSALTLPPGVAELVGDWQRHLALRVDAGELSAATLAAYKRGFARFLTFLETSAAPIGQVDADTLREWRKAERKAGHKPTSINAWFAATKSFYGWAVAAGRILADPTQGIKSEKREGTKGKHLRDSLTSAEVRRVLAMPDPTTPAGIRDLALIALLAYTGARTIEAHRADLADLKTRDGKLTLNVHGKGRDGKDEFVVLAHPAAERALYNWLAIRGNAPGALFVALGNRKSEDGRLSLRALRRLVKHYFGLAGIFDEAKTTHSLRHSAITTAIKRGAKPTQVQAMARHSNIETTLRYFHEQERLSNPAEAFVDYGEE